MGLIMIWCFILTVNSNAKVNSSLLMNKTVPTDSNRLVCSSDTVIYMYRVNYSMRISNSTILCALASPLHLKGSFGSLFLGYQK